MFVWMVLAAFGTIPGADPSGAADSSVALNKAIRRLCNATGSAGVSPLGTVGGAIARDASLDLEGGIYRLAAPIAVNASVVCTGMLRIHGGTLLADPSLADHRVPSESNPAGTNHSFLVTVLDYWNGLGVTMENIVFASNGTGGGLRVDAAHCVHVVDSQFLAFATIGIWGSKLLGMGHDLAVDRVRLTECVHEMAACADITKKQATAIVIEFPDSHFRNSVIACGKRGIVNRAGANDFKSLHIWTSCTGDESPSSNTTVGFADEVGSSRVSDCYFDNSLVVLSGYRGTTFVNNYFNGGARLVVNPPVKIEQRENQTVVVPVRPVRFVVFCHDACILAAGTTALRRCHKRSRAVLLETSLTPRAHVRLPSPLPPPLAHRCARRRRRAK